MANVNHVSKFFRCLLTVNLHQDRYYVSHCSLSVTVYLSWVCISKIPK